MLPYIHQGGVLALLHVAAYFALVHSQVNIDTQQPIIRTTPIPDNVYGYFSYAIALHQEIDVNENTDTTLALQSTVIIVSAPNDTHPSGQVSNTGLIYTCPLSPPGVCTGLTGDGTGADRRLYDRDDNSLQNGGEEKENQFMGVSMVSTGDVFVACAHKYANIAIPGTVTANELSYGIFGRCFYSDRTLSGFTELQPCENQGTRRTSSFGSCQAGTSATVAAESNGDDIIGLGTPGSSTWRGVVIRHDPDSGTTNFGLDGIGTGRFGLQGYTITKGHILDLNREDFVASVPRRNFYVGTVNIVSNSPTLSVISQPLQGMQMGEYYGFSLATADLTGDGLDELLVGAPLYSDDIIGPETGRVYVYRNVGGSLSLATGTPIVGIEKYARFGHAMANLGDVNGDGLDDVAISAPFGSGSGTVYIYHGSATQLITPTPQQVITVDDISTTVDLTGFKGFGTTLTSGVDVDANTYNDLAIGSFESQMVFLLRTRAVAQVATTLSANPNPVDVESGTMCDDGMPFTCFDVNVCVTYDGRGVSDQLTIDFVVFAERRNLEQGFQQRIFFGDAATMANQTGIRRNATRNVESCFPVRAYVNANITDIFNAFTFDLEAEAQELNVPPGDGMQEPTDLSNFPIAFIAGTTQLQVETEKRCSGEICVPDLQIRHLGVTYETDLTGVDPPEQLTAGLVSELSIALEITNAGDSAYAAQLSFVIPTGKLEYIRVEPVNSFVSCNREVLVDGMTQLNCPIGNPFENFAAVADDTINVILAPGDGLIGDEEMFTIEFMLSSINNESTTDDNSVNVTLDVDARADILLDDPGLVVPAQLSYASTAPEAGSNISNVTELGPMFSIIFVVRNSGPSTVPNIELSMYWPIRGVDTAQNFYFYPYSVSSSITLMCEQQNLNPLGLLGPEDDDIEQEEQAPGRQQGDGGGRRRRSVSGRTRRRRRAIPRKITKRQTETEQEAVERTLTCAGEIGGETTTGLTCVPITCFILQLARGESAAVEVTGYLDERYFANQTDPFTFVPVATARVSEPTHIVQPGGAVVQNSSATIRVISVTTIRPPSSSSDDFPVYAIILLIIAGIVIIGIAAAVLWGLGFFRRKKHEEIKKKREELHELANFEGGADASANGGN